MADTPAPAADDRCPPRDRLAVYPLRHTAVTRVADLDHNGHVNGVRICEFYEDARADFHRTMTVRSVRAFVAQFNVRYLAEVRWPCTLQVATGVTQVGNSSFQIGQALFQGERCVGQADTVLVHVVEGASRPLPHVYRAALEELRLADDVQPHAAAPLAGRGSHPSAPSPALSVIHEKFVRAALATLATDEPGDIGR